MFNNFRSHRRYFVVWLVIFTCLSRREGSGANEGIGIHVQAHSQYGAFLIYFFQERHLFSPYTTVSQTIAMTQWQLVLIVFFRCSAEIHWRRITIRMIINNIQMRYGNLHKRSVEPIVWRIFYFGSLVSQFHIANYSVLAITRCEMITFNSANRIVCIMIKKSSFFVLISFSFLTGVRFSFVFLLSSSRWHANDFQCLLFFANLFCIASR